jgi:hypothetical protein
MDNINNERECADHMGERARLKILFLGERRRVEEERREE